jgi:small multidrug resistance pump
MGYLFLAIAIVAEVIATTALKFTTGDGNKILPYTLVVIGYVTAFAMLSQSLAKGIPLGIAYAIWAAAGVVLVVIISWLLFKESLTWVQLVGMALVVAGVGLLELGGKH